MQREGFDVPLLIGGARPAASTPRGRFAPNYTGDQAVYVLDASRAVAWRNRCSAPTRTATRRDPRGIRSCPEAHARAESEKRRIPLATARGERLPKSTGRLTRREADVTGFRILSSLDVAELIPYID